MRAVIPAGGPSTRLPQTSPIRTRCVLCDALLEPHLRTRDFNHRLSATVFDIGRCPDCHTLVLRNVPEDLSSHYPSAYNAAVDGPDPDPHPEAFKLDLVERWATASRCRILEIGPGGGGFAGLAARAGHDVAVIDVDAASVADLQERYGVAGHAGADPVELLRGLGRFDVVALWQSLEHIPEVGSLLDELPDHLEAGGIVVIATPNPEALQLGLLRGRWTHLDAPRHIFLSPAPTLCNALTARGLEIAVVTYSDTGSVGWNRFGWQISLRNLGRGRAARWALVKAGRVIDGIAAPIERRHSRGTSYTVVARRRAS